MVANKFPQTFCFDFWYLPNKKKEYKMISFDSSKYNLFCYDSRMWFQEINKVHAYELDFSHRDKIVKKYFLNISKPAKIIGVLIDAES